MVEFLMSEFVCECGNEPHKDGFFPCDADGLEMEPTIKSSWDGLYLCARCGAVGQCVPAET